MSNSIQKKVLIIGGGVAGLSAAHELLKRGYKTTIIEKNYAILGGKARSIDYHPTAESLCLPAEHGFRFFPGFYGNITRTMKEIKVGDKTVYDNLVPVSYYTFLFTKGHLPVNIPVNIGFDLHKFRFGKVLREAKELRKIVDDGIIDISTEGRFFFTQRLFQLFTSCEERYIAEYERIPWSEFIEAENKAFGNDYKKLLAEGITKNLVACRADKACTRTGGKILAHMIWQIINPFGNRADRVLNAPTNQAWLLPWVDYLKSQYPDSFELITGKRAIELIVKQGKKEGEQDLIEAITINDKDNPTPEVEVIEGDYFIATLPIERLYSLLKRSPEILSIDPTLNLLEELSKQVEWMNGVVFYLNIDVPIADGHVTIVDSDLSITIFSQTQYWQEYLKDNPLPSHNGQAIKSVLSVIISNWDAKGIVNPTLTLKEMTHNQVIKEVWEQIKFCTIRDEKNGTYFKLTDNDCFLSLTFIDDSIVTDRVQPNRLFNKEPLLINTIVTHSLRPDSHTRVNNFFIASDFVKTNSDLADMDTANEAARKAVNNILLRDQRSDYCKTATYVLPTLFGLFSLARQIDKRAYRRGFPWRPFTPLLTFFNYSFVFFLRILKLPILVILPLSIIYLFILLLFITANFIILAVVSVILIF